MAVSGFQTAQSKYLAETAEGWTGKSGIFLHP